jgi:isopentenyldiphosphate isomerase
MSESFSTRTSLLMRFPSPPICVFPFECFLFNPRGRLLHNTRGSEEKRKKSFGNCKIDGFSCASRPLDVRAQHRRSFFWRESTMIVYLNEIYCAAHVVSIVCKRRHISKHSKKAKQKSFLHYKAGETGRENSRRRRVSTT